MGVRLTPKERKELVGTAAENVSWALAGRNLKLFQRKSWNGADEAIDDVGLFEACHGLLSHSVPLLFARITGKEPSAPVRELPHRRRRRRPT